MQSYQETLSQASHFIKENNDFLVVSHVNPDGDAIGSSLAMAHMLSNLNKNFVVANEGPVPKRFSFLTGIEQLQNFSIEEPSTTFTNVITVDSADEQRIGSTINFIADQSQILNIDHHPTNTLFGDLNLILSTAASTTEILYDLFHAHFKEFMDVAVAEALYTGLLTDTGGFRYSNTSQSVLEKAAYLLSYGIKPNVIAEHALETISVSYLGLLRQVLQSLQFSFKNKAASLTVTLADLKQSNASKDDVDGLISYPRNIEGVEVGILFKEISHDEVKVSLRSKNFVDVSEIAQRHGGGGHAKAAGFTFYGSITEAQELIANDLQKILGD